MTAKEQQMHSLMIKLSVLYIFITVVLGAVLISYMIHSNHQVHKQQAKLDAIAAKGEESLYQAAIANCNRIMTNRRSSNQTAQAVKNFLSAGAQARESAARELLKMHQLGLARTNLHAARTYRRLAASFGTLPVKECKQIIRRPR